MDTENPVAGVLFSYLRDVIYNPQHAKLDPDSLPSEFSNFGKGLIYYCNMVGEATALAKELANGNLKSKLPSPGNEVAAPLKMLHASLAHLTWQTQQVAQGDYHQRVDFMGDFSDAFNNMIRQLDQRQRINIDEKSRLKMYVDLMLANIPDPVWLFDRQGLLAYASESYLRCAKIQNSDALLGKKISDLLSSSVPEAFLRAVEAFFSAAADKKTTLRMDFEIDFSGCGEGRHYQIQFSPMMDSHGDVGGVMVIFHDVTESERARRESERLHILAEQSSHAKTIFLANMSHEMRTPLNAIIGMVSIARATGDINKIGNCLKSIEEASNQLLMVINDILDMSLIESSEFTLTVIAFDLQQMIRDVVKKPKNGADAKRQRFSVHIGANVPEMVMGDPDRLSLVITHLLDNAVKFTQEGGSVALTAETVADAHGICTIRMAVTDSGIGIRKEKQESIFQPFQQADDSIARQFNGTGLGLSIARSVVEMMGGEIGVTSEPGKGATFAFTVKMAHAAEETNASEEDNGTVEAFGAVEFPGCRILIADDIEINREIVMGLLESTLVGIDCAENGMEAVQMYNEAPEKYGMIFMDIQMPEMDGYEATRRIRTSGLAGADTIPIIAMTANVFPEDVAKCRAAGMDGHLGKPIDIGVLMGLLVKYLTY